ncbi:M23 family metallopeptidase [Flavobacterium sp. PLA-1-15]|uniref:M23 family metallopeptidase n=1 Tax=Flavobacterium sp. PLA-1-15 TaxID=3380533 RepID=UPI003B7DB12C
MTLRLLFLLLAIPVFSQNYPKDYFKSPLDIPLHLSGSFGELRSNHFHTGLDFKTQQKEGLNVYASAEGYVSRIKISTFGYGKAIYITHPNGYTTVYGHLKKASPTIEAYIRDNHYKEETYEIEMFPKPGDLPVKQGELIAFSGNSGGSGGPHLHFEFRDTQSEKPINPLLFGFDALIKDTKLPAVTTLMAYPVGENSSVNQSLQPITLNISLQPDGSYVSEKVAVNGKVGFGISSYDMFDFNYNKNGLYKVQSYLNGVPHFGYQFDTFAFDESRYINALLDFYRFKRMGVRIQQLFMTNSYPLSLIKTNENLGVIEVKPNLTNNYRIEVSDFNNNKVVVSVPIQYSPNQPTIANNIKKTDYFLKAKNDNIYKKDNMSVFVPAGTFYDDFYLNFDVKDDTLTFHDESVAVHNNFTVTIENNKFTPAEKEKMFIASVEGKRLSFNFTKIKDSVFTSYTKNLGKFVLAKDTTAPRITPVNIKEGKWLSNQSNLKLTISDNLSGIKTFSGYLNGKWVLFEYDYKTKTIVHEFEEKFLAEGRNDLKVVVTDNVGNSTIFETHFFRSQKK